MGATPSHHPLHSTVIFHTSNYWATPHDAEVSPNDGKLEVFTREGPFGVALAAIQIRFKMLKEDQKPLQKSK